MMNRVNGNWKKIYQKKTSNVAPNKLLEFIKHVAPKKAMLEGKISLELISVLQVY